MNGDAIAQIYAQVRAPGWAARNLDALADVLRDLSWLPDGPVEVRLPDLSALTGNESTRLSAVLHEVARETATRARPVHIIG